MNALYRCGQRVLKVRCVCFGSKYFGTRAECRERHFLNVTAAFFIECSELYGDAVRSICAPDGVCAAFEQICNKRVCASWCLQKRTLPRWLTSVSHPIKSQLMVCTSRFHISTKSCKTICSALLCSCIETRLSLKSYGK